MSFNITYKTLFTITVLHGYFLNSGNEEYNSMTPDKKKKALHNYDFGNLIEIHPTKETLLKLKNNHLVYRTQKSEIRIEAKTNPDDANVTFANVSVLLTLDFILKIKDRSDSIVGVSAEILTSIEVGETYTTLKYVSYPLINTFFNPVKPVPCTRINCPKRANETSLSGTEEFTSSRKTLLIAIGPPPSLLSLLSHALNNMEVNSTSTRIIAAPYFLFKI